MSSTAFHSFFFCLLAGCSNRGAAFFHDVDHYVVLAHRQCSRADANVPLCNLHQSYVGVPAVDSIHWICGARDSGGLHRISFKDYPELPIMKKACGCMEEERQFDMKA